jgi:hypothetical protein
MYNLSQEVSQAGLGGKHKKKWQSDCFLSKGQYEEENTSSRLTRTRSVTHQGNVNEWNNKAVEISGFSVDDIMGRNLVEEFILVTFLYTLTHQSAHHLYFHAACQTTHTHMMHVYSFAYVCMYACVYVRMGGYVCAL